MCLGDKIGGEDALVYHHYKTNIAILTPEW